MSAFFDIKIFVRSPYPVSKQQGNSKKKIFFGFKGNSSKTESCFRMIFFFAWFRIMLIKKFLEMKNQKQYRTSIIHNGYKRYKVKWKKPIREERASTFSFLGTCVAVPERSFWLFTTTAHLGDITQIGWAEVVGVTKLVTVLHCLKQKGNKVAVFWNALIINGKILIRSRSALDSFEALKHF